MKHFETEKGQEDKFFFMTFGLPIVVAMWAGVIFGIIYLIKII